jgi:hypothetical protein
MDSASASQQRRLRARLIEGIADGLASGARLAGWPWLMTPADAGRS